MSENLPAIRELERVAAPCPDPLGIAHDGSALWLGSGETDRIYRFDPGSGAISDEAATPGSVYGLAAHGDELRAVVGDAEDDRFLARYVRGSGFDATTIPCPGRTGSWLAFDGARLFMSQRFEKRILELDAAGDVVRTFAVAREITGMTMVDGTFCLITTASRDVDDYRFVRLDPSQPQPAEVEVASIPFAGARGLAYDGATFWTSLRAANTIVAFTTS
jgi:hypothetical protein